MIHKDR